MAKYTIEDTTLTNIAEAIRIKGGTTEGLTPIQMPDAINAIQAGGGDTPTPTHRTRTPEEVYAEDRPSDWPVLPTPTQDNEFYFLCARTGTDTNVVMPQLYGSTTGKPGTVLEWGYIDDDGSFVITHSLEDDLLGWYWTKYGLAADKIVAGKMDKYYVLHTTGVDVSYEPCTSGSHSSGSYMKYVLEIKARCSNPKFRTGVTASYPNNFPSCQFITLYGPQNWTGVEHRFENMYSLRALLFDSEENNPFLHDNAITSAYKIFSYARALQCYYPLENWSKLTDITDAYGYTYQLAPDYLSFENNTATTIGSCLFIKPIRASLKIPKVTSGKPFGNSSALYYDNLDVSSYTASGHSTLYNATCGSVEINNLKVGPLKLTASNVLHNTSYGDSNTSYQYLQKVTMSPEQTGDNMPSSWTVCFPNVSFANLKLFLNSLPEVSSSKTLTIIHGSFGRGAEIPTELLEIATSKGYTISFSW